MNILQGIINRGMGTHEHPFQISGEEYQAIEEWVAPREAKLAGMEPDEQEKYIAACRKEAKEKWPWWFPHCHVKVI